MVAFTPRLHFPPLLSSVSRGRRVILDSKSISRSSSCPWRPWPFRVRPSLPTTYLRHGNGSDHFQFCPKTRGKLGSIQHSCSFFPLEFTLGGRDIVPGLALPFPKTFPLLSLLAHFPLSLCLPVCSLLSALFPPSLFSRTARPPSCSWPWQQQPTDRREERTTRFWLALAGCRGRVRVRFLPSRLGLVRVQG